MCEKIRLNTACANSDARRDSKGQVAMTGGEYYMPTGICVIDHNTLGNEVWRDNHTTLTILITTQTVIF